MSEVAEQWIGDAQESIKEVKVHTPTEQEALTLYFQEGTHQAQPLLGELPCDASGEVLSRD